MYGLPVESSAADLMSPDIWVSAKTDRMPIRINIDRNVNFFMISPDIA
jgi:hypothetical protein